MAQNFRGYFFRKTIYAAITVFLILSFNFVLFRAMPGDVTHIVIPRGASEQKRLELTEYYGLDKPRFEQYLIYLDHLFKGQLGESIDFRKNADVIAILPPFLLNTLILVGTGTVISVMAGIVLGRITAWKRGKAADRVGSAFFLVFYCMPTFLFGLIMVTMVGKYVPDWPISGAYGENYPDLSIWGKIGERAIYTVLPLSALVVETIATFSIITRSSLIDVMTEEYMVTAVAKGLKGKKVLHDHAMPNAMLPVVTVVAMNVGWIMSGSIMIEVIFSYQGLGYMTWEAVRGYDYPVLQAVFMLEAIAVVVANFIADMTLFRLDPRVKI
jgi:ABC-type dipeptide/oligopeptide/nickel transport system permease component